MNRALLLTYSFPPSSHSNATRPYLLAKKLLEKDWAVDVVCSTFGVKDDATEYLSHKNLRVRRVKDPFRFIYKRCFGLGRWIELAANILTWPDVRIAWVVRVLFFFHHHYERYDVVVGSIVPRSMLLGPIFKKKMGRAWVLDYQEPVSVEQLGWVKTMPLQVLFWPLLKRLESLALQHCTQAVFSCESCRSEYVSRNLIERIKADVHYHCYDETSFADSVRCQGDHFDIVYAGNFSGSRRGDRNPRTFLYAFRKFLDRCPEAAESARFVFFGSWRSEHDIYLDDLGLRKNVILNDKVGYDEYIERIKKSPVLLLVISPQHNLHLPGKLVEYFGAKRPILAFVDHQSEVHSILVDSGYNEFTCGVDDSDSGCDSLEKLWSLWTGKKLEEIQYDTTRWSSAVQMEQYAEHITNLERQAESKGG